MKVSSPSNASPTRYGRQERLDEIGERGQRRLGEQAVVVLGCGALGSVSAELLVRGGIGRVDLVDRDIIELSNLHRQLLYDERDVAAATPKAIAARDRLRQVNSEVVVDGQVVDVGPHNIHSLVEGADLVLDGTDNVETRYLLNDVCLELSIPWIYAGAVGTSGMTMNVLPGDGPCLRCLFPEPPPPGSLPTCETAGVLNALTVGVASLQVVEAIKILTGSNDVSRDLLTIEPWSRRFRTITVPKVADCPACVGGQLDHLAGYELTEITPLCGQNAVQIQPAQQLGLSLEQLQTRLSPLPEVREITRSEHLLRCRIDALELRVFADARAVVKGTIDPVVAKGIYAKYVGA